MSAIFRKEMADYFNSARFVVFFLLVFASAALALFAVHQGIRSANPPEGFVFLALFTTSGEVIPSLVSLLGILIPIIGIALGFDAINSERSNGTLSRVLSQPIYRDNVINGKFLAGILTIAIMLGTTLLLVSGYGLRMIGVPPTSGEIIRLFFFFVVGTAYGAFWLALAILFSIIMRRIAASLLVSLAIWLFFVFFISIIALAVANGISPVNEGTSQEAIIHNLEIRQTIMLFSPQTLFSNATAALLSPRYAGTLGIISSAQIEQMRQFLLPNPLSLTQSLVLIWPYATGLVSLSIICFAVSYITFMRQEIRAT